MTKIGKRRHTMVLIIAFFGIITGFFYCVIVGTMPKYKSVSSPQEIAATDLSQDYICLDSSLAQVYPGRLYTHRDFAAARAIITAAVFIRAAVIENAFWKVENIEEINAL